MTDENGGGGGGGKEGVNESLSQGRETVWNKGREVREVRELRELRELEEANDRVRDLEIENSRLKEEGVVGERRLVEFGDRLREVLGRMPVGEGIGGLGSCFDGPRASSSHSNGGINFRLRDSEINPNIDTGMYGQYPLHQVQDQVQDRVQDHVVFDENAQIERTNERMQCVLEVMASKEVFN